MKEIAEIEGLHDPARLDTTVSVIDSFDLFVNFNTSEFLSDRYGSDQTTPEDERTIKWTSRTLLSSKIDSIDVKAKEHFLALVKKLNPSAKVLEARYSKIDVKKIINTNMFTFEKAATGAGWLRSLHELTMREIYGVDMMVPKPETEVYVYTIVS